jgi:hypothetical protein
LKNRKNLGRFHEILINSPLQKLNFWQFIEMGVKLKKKDSIGQLLRISSKKLVLFLMP